MLPSTFWVRDFWIWIDWWCETGLLARISSRREITVDLRSFGGTRRTSVLLWEGLPYTPAGDLWFSQILVTTWNSTLDKINEGTSLWGKYIKDRIEIFEVKYARLSDTEVGFRSPFESLILSVQKGKMDSCIYFSQSVALFNKLYLSRLYNWIGLNPHDT